MPLPKTQDTKGKTSNVEALQRSFNSAKNLILLRIKYMPPRTLTTY